MTDSAHPCRFAALDLGSLTVRLAVAERTPSGGNSGCCSTAGRSPGWGRGWL